MHSVFLWLLACTGPAVDTPDDGSGAPEPAPASGSFTALTYNVQGLPDELAEADRPGAERMVRISPLLEPFDVVGLQEDFDADNHALLVADTTHPDQSWFGELLDTSKVYGSGLALLSRVGTALEDHHEHYTTCNGVFDGSSDCLASKGFQVRSLDLGDGARLALVNTHHEAGGGADDDAARRAQVEQVLAALDGPFADHAVVFLGDFNLRWTDPEDVDELELYTGAGLRDGCREVGCPEDTHIDKVWLRDGGGLALEALAWSREEAFVDEDGADLSDHPAIALEIGWSRP